LAIARRTKTRDSPNGHSSETNYCKSHAKEEFDKVTEEKIQAVKQRLTAQYDPAFNRQHLFSLSMGETNENQK